jgi:hypothetical protein
MNSIGIIALTRMSGARSQRRKMMIERIKRMSDGKKGIKLARFDLIPTKALWLLSEVYGRGAMKYAPRNYERGYEWSKSYGALQRHLNQWWSGETYDEENGQHHLAAAMWHCAALLEFEDTHPEHDDRPRPVTLRSELLNPEEIEEARQEIVDFNKEQLNVAPPSLVGLYGGKDK